MINGSRRSGRTRNILLALMLVVIVAAVMAVYVANGLRPTAAGKPVHVTVPSGTGTLGVADILEKNGLIRNRTLFAGYLKVTKQGDRFQAGEYEMAPGISLSRIVDMLNKGETVKVETFRFTIPEGYTVEQVAAKLEEQKLTDAAAFIKLADTAAFPDATFPEPPPTDAALKHRLEGYLFPETYEMKKSSTPEEMLDRMASEWKRKLAELPAGWEEKMKQQGMNFHQLLTVASLIEKEVAVNEERPLVASVIFNRLRIKQPLQIDATVLYALKEPKERLMEADLRTESPYNTYLHPGLPPGPIASPGLASVKAALEPVDSNFYYYVTKKDGSRKHLFAETYDQHLKNIELSKKAQ